MRILYVSQYFPPEIGPPAVRVSEMSAHWRDWGEDVRVLTGFPNHPDGEIHPNYRAAFRRGAHTETFRGLQVYRTWLYPAANKGVFRRSANYASFMLSAIARGAWLGFRPRGGDRHVAATAVRRRGGTVGPTVPGALCIGGARPLAGIPRSGGRVRTRDRSPIAHWTESRCASTATLGRSSS